jgi:DNA-binding transcriptional MerR regulator
VKAEGGTYRIGELAKLAGVSPDTIRNYERRGVLPPALRGANAYRRFPATALQRVAVIQRALDAGFSLADLRRVLRVRDSGGAPCRQVYAIAEERLAELERRISTLQVLRDELAAAIGEWKVKLAATPAGERAALLDAWAARVVDRPTRPRLAGVNASAWRSR